MEIVENKTRNFFKSFINNKFCSKIGKKNFIGLHKLKDGKFCRIIIAIGKSPELYDISYCPATIDTGEEFKFSKAILEDKAIGEEFKSLCELFENGDKNFVNIYDENSYSYVILSVYKQTSTKMFYDMICEEIQKSFYYISTVIGERYKNLIMIPHTTRADITFFLTKKGKDNNLKNIVEIMKDKKLYNAEMGFFKKFSNIRNSDHVSMLFDMLIDEKNIIPKNFKEVITEGTELRYFSSETEPTIFVYTTDDNLFFGYDSNCFVFIACLPKNETFTKKPQLKTSGENIYDKWKSSAIDHLYGNNSSNMSTSGKFENEDLISLLESMHSTYMNITRHSNKTTTLGNRIDYFRRTSKILLHDLLIDLSTYTTIFDNPEMSRIEKIAKENVEVFLEVVKQIENKPIVEKKVEQVEKKEEIKQVEKKVEQVEKKVEQVEKKEIKQVEKKEEKPTEKEEPLDPWKGFNIKKEVDQNFNKMIENIKTECGLLVKKMKSIYFSENYIKLDTTNKEKPKANLINDDPKFWTNEIVSVNNVKEKYLVEFEGFYKKLFEKYKNLLNIEKLANSVHKDYLEIFKINLDKAIEPLIKFLKNLVAKSIKSQEKKTAEEKKKKEMEEADRKKKEEEEEKKRKEDEEKIKKLEEERKKREEFEKRVPTSSQLPLTQQQPLVIQSQIPSNVKEMLNKIPKELI